MPAEEPVEAPPQEPRSSTKRLDIQGLRAVAVILVVAFHAGLPLPGGFTGVDVFLVISGFVITAMLLRELDSTGSLRFRHFYARRIKRLLPALALTTTIVVALAFFLGSPFGSQQTTAKTGLGATYLSANVVIYKDSTVYFAPEASKNPLLNTWTLSVEEQVYLVFPALLLGSWIVGRRLLKGSRRGAVVMLAIAGGASFILSLVTSLDLIPTPLLASPRLFAFYSSTTRLWEFAVGAGLALAATRLSRISAKVAVPLGILGVIAIGIGTFTITGETPFPGVAVLLPVAGAAAIITAGFRPSAGLSRVLATKPMAWIGDLSYSWYLWHWPLIVFATMIWPTSTVILVAVGILSLIPAWLSRRFIEDPIRGSKRIAGWRVVALAAVCTLIPTAACIGLWLGANASWGSETIAHMQSQVHNHHIAAKRKCDDAETNGTSIGERQCEYNVFGKGPHVYLVGNSVAAQYSEALIGATAAIGSPLSLDTTHGCFIGGDVNAVGRATDRACSDTFRDTVATLIEQPPGIVVMSSTWDLGTLGGNDSVATQAATEARQLMVSSLTEAVDGLHAAGHDVLIVMPTPHFYYGQTPGTFEASPAAFDTRLGAHASLWQPSECWNIVALGDTQKCGAIVTEAQVEDGLDLTNQALLEVAGQTGADTLELHRYFCWDGSCRTNDGNDWLFQDGLHITPIKSKALAPAFAEVLAFEPPAEEDPYFSMITSGPSPEGVFAKGVFEFSSIEPRATFECSLDGSEFRRCVSPVVHNNLVSGSHTFQVRATDEAGTTDPTPATWTWSSASSDSQEVVSTSLKIIAPPAVKRGSSVTIRGTLSSADPACTSKQPLTITAGSTVAGTHDTDGRGDYAFTAKVPRTTKLGIDFAGTPTCGSSSAEKTIRAT